MERETLFTRVSLLERAQLSIDAPAWDELLEYYGGFINKALLIFGLQGDEIDDARQVVLINFWESLKNYSRTGRTSRFRDWLFILIRNIAYDERKKRAKQLVSTSDLPLEEFADEKQSAFDKRILEEWEHYIVEKAIARLKNVFSGKALVVLAMSMNGSASEEIARQLDIALTSVYVLKNRVKTRLKQEIASLRYELEGV